MPFNFKVVSGRQQFPSGEWVITRTTGCFPTVQCFKHYRLLDVKPNSIVRIYLMTAVLSVLYCLGCVLNRHLERVMKV